MSISSRRDWSDKAMTENVLKIIESLEAKFLRKARDGRWRYTGLFTKIDNVVKGHILGVIETELRHLLQTLAQSS